MDGIGGRVLVIFDGHCGFCNGCVRWLLERDRRDRLRFASFERAEAAGLLRRHGQEAAGGRSGAGTILVVRGAGRAAEEMLRRSDAVAALLRELPRPWPSVAAALAWIPRPVRDLGYRLVARWRYRIRGRVESCPLPAAEERERFL